MAAPALPKSVTVGPVDFAVVADPVRARDADVGFGFTDVKHAELVLNPDVAPGQIRDTLLHEVLHALCYAIGVAKGGDKALLDEDAEERLVHPLATALLDTLRRNPALVAFLLAD